MERVVVPHCISLLETVRELIKTSEAGRKNFFEWINQMENSRKGLG